MMLITFLISWVGFVAIARWMWSTVVIWLILGGRGNGIGMEFYLHRSWVDEKAVFGCVTTQQQFFWKFVNNIQAFDSVDHDVCWQPKICTIYVITRLLELQVSLAQGVDLGGAVKLMTKMSTLMSMNRCTKQYMEATHRGPLRICIFLNVKCMMTEIQNIEGGWKDVSS